jgi:hypothetical protein
MGGRGGLSCSPLCADVGAGLGDLVGGGYDDFLATVQTVDAGVAGVYNAAVAYHQAGTDMAAQTAAEQRASEIEIAAVERDFTFFEQNGYTG